MTNTRFESGAIDPTACISNAWNMIKPDYWLYFGIAILTAIAISCIPCVNVLLVGPMMGGVYYVALRAMRGDTVDFSMMFKGFEKFVPLMVVGLIQSIPAIISQILDITFRVSDVFLKASSRSGGSTFFQSSGPDKDVFLAGGVLVVVLIVGALFFLFSIAWSITFAFAIPIAMEQNIGPIDAIKLSARASWSNVGGIIVLSILLGLMLLGGFIVFCIGALFVLPIVYVAWAFAYRQVFPGPDPTPYQGPTGYSGMFNPD